MHCYCNTFLRNRRKDEILLEKDNKRMKEKRKICSMEAARKGERAMESKQAFKAWNEKKRTSLHTAKITPQSSPARPAWCPARSLHRVPSLRLSGIQSSRKLSFTRHHRQEMVAESYSQDSFSSDSGSGCSCRENSTGTLKTVQVCCKTLEYWCICDHKIVT